MKAIGQLIWLAVAVAIIIAAAKGCASDQVRPSHSFNHEVTR